MAVALEAAVTRIRKADGAIVGTGFLVTGQLVLTCAHVVAQALGVSETTPERPASEVKLDFPLLPPCPLLSAEVVFWLPVQPSPASVTGQGEDIAVLQLRNPPASARPVRLVKGQDLWGHPFRAFGFPASQDHGVWTSGELRAPQAAGWVQMDGVSGAAFRVEPGFSGGPVLDDELDGVVGMVVAAVRGPERVAFCIPTQTLIRARPELDHQAIPVCPYRGLFAFREQDKEFFCGREAMTVTLTGAVSQKPLVAVIGPSGSGKSSLVFAGLLPRLRSSPDWLVSSFRPTISPFHALAAALLPLLEPKSSETERLLAVNQQAKAFQQGELRLRQVVERILQKNPAARRLLLFGDQFEELYTLSPDADRRRFLDVLLDSLPAPGQPADLTVLLTLRADFYEHALSHRPLADALQDAQINLGPMNRRELTEAVEQPARRLDVAVEDGLTDRILEAVSAEEGRLPLLEFALTLLWARQEGGRLTHAAYEQVGGVSGALVQYAEQVYDSLGATDRDEAAKVFVQMVDPGKWTEDTRRRAGRRELGEEKWKLVTRLASARLVVTGRDEATGVEAVEVVHETLLKKWDRLRAWMEGDRRFRTWQERLRSAMRLWEANGKDRGGLLRGAALAEAKSWLAKRRDDVSGPERQFIRASVALRNWWRGIAVLGVLAIAVLAGIIVMAGARLPVPPPSAQRVNADESRFDRYPEMIQAAREKGDVRRAQKLLAELRAKDWERSESFWWYYYWKQCHRDSHTLTHRKEVRAVAFSPDGGKLASAVGDWKQSGTISLWGRDGTKEVYSRENNIYSVAFSPPDGLKLAAGTRDGEVLLLDLNTDGTKAKENSLGKQNGSVYAVAFSPDGRSLASVSGDEYDQTAKGQLKIWNKTGDSWKELKSIDGEKRGFLSVAWLPDENLATASWDGPVCLWNGTTGQVVRSFGDATPGFTSVAVSPDGKTLAASRRDTIVLWELGTGRQLGEMAGHTSRLTALAFASNETLASGSLDHTVRLWDVASQKLLDTLVGHDAAVTCLAMRPDGKTLASGSQDGTTKVWEMSAVGRDVLPHETAVHAVAWSSGGLLASGAEKGWVHLWDVEKARVACRNQTSESFVMGVAFTPDARRWVTGDTKGNVRLWDRNKCEHPDPLGRHGAVYSVATSPDGRLAATASGTRDPTVALWDLATKEHWPLSPKHDGAVNGVAFSSTGRLLASVSADRMIRLWDMSNGAKSPPCVRTIATDTIIWAVCFVSEETLATGHEDGTVRLWDLTASTRESPVQTLEGHVGRVYAVAFTSRGKTLASGSEDGSVRLWSPAGGTWRQVTVLREHKERVYSLAFSADGKTLASGSADHTVRLWRAAAEEEVRARSQEDMQLLGEK